VISINSQSNNDPHGHQIGGLRRHRRHLPLGSVGYEAKRTDEGEVLIRLERGALDRLDALRQPGEGYSEVILRMAQIEASRPGPRRGGRG
jgi:hypothetical protein